MRMLKGFVEGLGLVGVTRIKAKLQDLPPSLFLSPILIADPLSPESANLGQN